jgi:hypothetical protein
VHAARIAKVVYERHVYLSPNGEITRLVPDEHSDAGAAGSMSPRARERRRRRGSGRRNQLLNKPVYSAADEKEMLKPAVQNQARRRISFVLRDPGSSAETLA